MKNLGFQPNINDIKPSINGESDKYSWNLYSYLKKNKGEHRILWDNYKGVKLHPMNVYVLQGTIGRTLLSILWHGNRGDKHCFSRYPLDNYLDITKQFWDDYEWHGRCVFHDHNEAWLQGGESRYMMLGDDLKECHWCGAVLRKTVETVVTEVERWEVI